MQKFIARRLLFMLFSLFGATAVVFAMSRMTGDPMLLYAKPGGYGLTPEQTAFIRKKLGLDRPLVVQYFMWISNVFRGDLGRTLLDERPVVKIIGEKWGNTMQLGLAAGIFSVLVGVPLGVLSAVRRGTVWDYMGRMFALFGMATPGFWIGLMFIFFFGVKLHWLPTGTKYGYETFPLSWDNIKHFILPAIVLGWYPAAGFLRITRSAMLEILDSEFVKFARAKGVRQRWVIWKHAFRNAIIPPLTLIAVTLTGFITGAVVVEQVFAWPGLGSMAIYAVFNNDFPLLTGITLIFILLFATANFLADLAYGYLDPRIRYE
ncbi:MAG: ABC transporter permease [Chloroflexota bacterium]|nr:ABC transporter permease [Chloroflexota bacterium]